MKSRGSNARIRRRAMYAIYIVAAIVGVSLVFYMNIRRARNLRRIQERRLLTQEQFDADPRYRNLSIGIDRAMLVSTLTGSVAKGEDLNELKKMISKIPPFPGTRNWRIEVEVKENAGR